jgi:hypothetical protein
MSNPVATIGSTIPVPTPDPLERNSFSFITFKDQNFFVYGEGQYDPSFLLFDPTFLGARSFLRVRLEDALEPVAGPPTPPPDFITQDSWDNSGVKQMASCFVTGVHTVMPKLFIPNTLLVDNGLYVAGAPYGFLMGAYSDVDAVPPVEAFNWEVKDVNGGGPPHFSELFKYANISVSPGRQYITVNASVDDLEDTKVELELKKPVRFVGNTAPTPTVDGWNVATDLVVGGAFTLVLGLEPVVPGAADAKYVADNQWSIEIEFGECKMVMSEIGSLRFSFADNLSVGSDGNELTVNLVQGKTKEGPPQQNEMVGKEPYVITVYPVWNGVIVMSGNIDSVEAISTASTFIPWTKGRSPLEYAASPFDPTSPAEVEVGVGSGTTNTIPDFGDTMTVTAKNIQFDMAYLPCFFSRSGWFDEFFVVSDDIAGVVSYDYNMYALWTKNGTATTLGPTTVGTTTFPGPVSDSSYRFVEWRLDMTSHDRHAGEIFGSYFEIQEERDSPIKNGNGSFDIAWSGGTPGDPSPSADWEDYIQSINVSIGLSGSSGSMVVDKYGIAGQTADATQDVGAITISMTGGFGTNSGPMFKGLAMGIGEAMTTEGATWDIPLVGQEKKLEDIALINVPFFDGETAQTVLEYLADYAGINLATAGTAPNTVIDRLSVSEDVNVPIFDWKSGTSVADALEDVMKDLNYAYTVFDGFIKVYELDSFGLPAFTLTLPDWEPFYPDTKIVQIDATPDLDDIRNEIVVLGLEAIPEGSANNIDEIPLYPLVEMRSSVTTPDIPWAKSMIDGISGTVTQAELSDIADNFQSKSQSWVKLGKTTIPGNADIRPYHRWGSAFIYSVTQNIDFVGKTWTTDLEFSLH